MSAMLAKNRSVSVLFDFSLILLVIISLIRGSSVGVVGVQAPSFSKKTPNRDPSKEGSDFFLGRIAQKARKEVNAFLVDRKQKVEGMKQE